MMRWWLVVGLVVGAVVETQAADTLVQTASQYYDNIVTEKLPNGLTVIIKPIPGSPIVSTKVAYRVGAADEELEHTGLSHYLEHLMFKGTTKLLPGDIDRLTQQNGGKNNAYTSEDYTLYHFDFSVDRWTTALEIEADRMRNLVIDEKHEFEQEKGAVISELEGGEDEPWDLESKTILPLLFGSKTPYGHPIIGSREHVRESTAEIIKNHYDRWYHPNNAYLIVVGGVDPKEAMKEIRNRFSDIPAGKLPERKPIPKQEPRLEIVRKEIPSKFDLPRMIMGFNGVQLGTREDYALDVISTILTDGKSSRLHRRLISDEGSTADVQSSNLAGRYPGWFAIQVELFADGDREGTERILFEELKKLATKPLTPEEFKRVQRRMLALTIFQQEDAHEAGDRLAQAAASLGDANYAKTYLEKLNSITAEDVMRTTQKLLLDQKPVIVWSVPGKEEKCGTVSSRLPGRKLQTRQYRDVKAVGSGKEFTFENAKRKVLPNGVTVLMLENHQLPIIAVRTMFRNAMIREPANQIGIVAMTGSMMEDGTPTRDSREIADLIEPTGAIFDVSISDGHLKVLTPDFDLGMELYFDCLFHPEFSRDSLEGKRELILATIKELQEDPNYRARETFERLVYGNHPLGRPALGRPNVIKKLIRDDCVRYHADVCRPDQLIVAVVGDFDEAKLLAMLEKLTPPNPKEPQSPVTVAEAPEPDEFLEKILTDAEANQVHMYLGHIGVRRNHPDYYKLLVMDHILGTGTGFTDRLSSNLRDRQGLAYSVTASITSSAQVEPGLFMAYMGTFPDKYEQARDGLLKEIRRISTEKASIDEVENAKKYLLGSFAFKFATNAEMADELVEAEQHNLGRDYPAQFRKAVLAVTPEDVLAVAKKHLRADQLTLVAAGPLNRKGQPLKK